MSLRSRLPAKVRAPLGRLRRRLRPGQVQVSMPLRPEVRVIAVEIEPEASLSPQERLALRRTCALEHVVPDPRILEIGAAHHGTFPKREGFRTTIVDHADRAALVEKYRGFEQYDMAAIEEVDHVLVDGAGLTDVVAERFDLVYASHVIEHSVSLIHFLNECGTLLAPGGVLALVVPDARYTFDRFRERASIGRVIDTFRSPPAVHTAGTLVEFGLYAVKHRGSTSWLAGHRGDYSMVRTTAEARALGGRADDGTYIDVHNWVVTPQHFRLLLQDLADLGYIHLRECFFHDTVGHEFFLNLSLDGAGTGLVREELLVLADEELSTRDRPRFEATETATGGAG